MRKRNELSDYTTELQYMLISNQVKNDLQSKQKLHLQLMPHFHTLQSILISVTVSPLYYR